MLKNIIQAVLLAIILTSCQREVSIIQRLNNDPLLVKIISVTAPQNDSAIITFDYNTDRQLTKQTYYTRYNTPSGPLVLPSWSEYTRDTRGRITRIKSVGRSVTNPAVEITRFGDVYYINDSSTRVAFTVSDNNDHKKIYFYDNAGQIIKTEDHQSFSPSDPLHLVVYHLYQYDGGGNLIERKEYTDHDHNGSFELNIGMRIQYDGKVNPRYKLDDALFEESWLDVSPENFLKMYVDNPHPLSIQDTVAQQYTYRGDGRPEMVAVSGNSIPPSFRTYFYQ